MVVSKACYNIHRWSTEAREEKKFDSYNVIFILVENNYFMKMELARVGNETLFLNDFHNRREKDRNAQLILDMQGSTTSITDPSSKEQPRKFTFDFSYWSHDGFKEESSGYCAPDLSQPNGKKFADQKKVYDELGVGVLKNAWEGYNSTLFAYGQTGSGKSWSMVGYGVNKGIVPMFCDNIFQQIEKKKTEGAKEEFEVTFSMLEIYNEAVRDLLDPNPRGKGGLPVRQHPKTGFYADGLIVVPVANYSEIEKKMDEGTRNRTVAATNMNATSSRAHTIVGITFIQKSKNAAGEEMARSAIINLVDLAGSERAESTGATGDRLKEGAAINQSLSCLGNCIAALADRSSGKDSRVPYRDSVLTKLLKNALGGNSKTIMIAALSPADINFEETLSTLRYADRAKQIKNSAKVNEDPTAQLIRELQEENERLKAMLSSGKMEMIKGDDENDDDMSEEEKAKLKAELEQQYTSLLEKNAKEMEEMKKTFEQKLAEAQSDDEGLGTAEIQEKKKKIPHFSNLNMDPMLTGHVIHFFEQPESILGSAEDCKFRLKGPSLMAKHATVKNNNGIFSLVPETNARIIRNGKPITGESELHHNDRLVFGTTQYFVFVNPKERDSSKEKFPEVTFESAQEELAKKSGFDVSGQNKSKDETLLQEDMLEIMPKIEQANSISDELEKNKRFDLLIVAPEARGELKGRTEVMVRVTDLNTKHEWIWDKTKFFNRFFVMQEMYTDSLEGDDPWDLPPETDPFYEDYKVDFHVGSVKVWLKSLAFLIDSNEQLDITDYRGQEIGKLNIEMLPCDAKGKVIVDQDNVFVENPNELVGKDINFKLKITSARGLPAKFSDIYVKYKFFLEDQFTQTKSIPNTSNPDWNFEKTYSFPAAKQQLVDYLKDEAFIVQLWGKQKDQSKKGATKIKQSLLPGQKAIHAANTNEKRFDPEKVKFMMETAMLKKRQERLEQKLAQMKKMIEVAEQHKKKRLRTELIKDIYMAQTADKADKCIALIPKEKDDDDDDESDSDSDEEMKKIAIISPQPQKERRKSGSSSSSDFEEKDKKNKDDETKKKENEEKKKKEQEEKNKKEQEEKNKKEQETKKKEEEKKRKEEEKKHKEEAAKKESASKKTQKSSSCILL
ncbi:hypothetical protein CHS0354_043156 [Potamilus streckersoni]|uniref:Kinesin-like protein 6 n=1 Tax=Potamilus streckersoni TaxID=2493646 RepID=A0AAE0SNQ8_9BIVA|nr:hypothetical protein CHS0354_043156 [Potamilus streckersoni]